MSNIKKKLLAIDRRNFLKGIYNVGIALPIMDFMLNSSGTAYAQGVELEKAYISFYNGISPNPSFSIPADAGPMQTIAHRGALKKIKESGQFNDVIDQLTIVSNLFIPDGRGGGRRGTGKNSSNPGISSTAELHGNAHIVQYCGASTGEQNDYSSVDVYLARQLGIQLRDTVYTSVQMYHDYPRKENRDRYLRYDKDSSGGVDNHTKFAKKPNADYKSIFNSFVSNRSEILPGQEGGESTVSIAQKMKKSVLDFIDKERIDYLKKLLPNEARQKFEAHRAEVRDLERSLSSSAPVVSQASKGLCNKSTNVKLDNFNESNSYYSQELERGNSLVELLKLAAACGSLKIGMIPITFPSSTIRPGEIVKYYNGSVQDPTSDYHHYSHNKKSVDHEAMVRWHYEIMLKTAQAFKQIKIGSKTFLDQAILSLGNEGGWDESYGDQFTHAGTNMYGSYITGLSHLKQGQHIKLGKRAHAAEFHLSLMRAFGYSGNLGGVSRLISEMNS